MSNPPREERVSVESRVWWSALGGINAISLWSWIVTTALAVFVAGAYEVPTFDYRLWQRLGLILAVQVTLIPALVVGHLILARLPRSMPIIGLLIFAVIGALRGISITVLAPFIEPLARPGIGFQIIVGITYALLSLPFIAIVVDSLRRHRSLQAQVLTAQEGWEQALQETKTQFDAEYAVYRQRVNTDVNARIITLTDDLASVARDAAAAGAIAAADDLRRLSAEVVRPLSHELILKGAPARVAPVTFIAPPPLFGLRDVLRNAPRTPTAGHWVVCAAMVFLGAVGLAPLTTPAFITVNIAWDIAIFGLAPLLVRAVGGRWWSHSSTHAAWLASLALWVGLAVVGVTGTAILGGLITANAVLYWSAGAFYVLISAGTVIAWTAFRRLHALQDEYITLLREQEDLAADVMARLDRDRRHLGLVLHGSVQSSLAQAAHTLERWASEMDIDALPEVITQVRGALTTAMSSIDVEPPSGESLASVLNERFGLWVGSIECSLTVSAEALGLQDPLLLEQVGDITGEAITNAVRHGQADAVWIDVDASDGALVLIVTDNGLGSDDSGPVGGGIGHLTHSGYAWTLERERDRTVLTVHIPLLRPRLKETVLAPSVRSANPLDGEVRGGS